MNLNIPSEWRCLGDYGTFKMTAVLEAACHVGEVVEDFKGLIATCALSFHLDVVSQLPASQLLWLIGSLQL